MAWCFFAGVIPTVHTPHFVFSVNRRVGNLFAVCNNPFVSSECASPIACWNNPCVQSTLNCRIGDPSFPQPPEGMLVFDLSQEPCAEWFASACTNMTDTGYFDSCNADRVWQWKTQGMDNETEAKYKALKYKVQFEPVNECDLPLHYPCFCFCWTPQVQWVQETSLFTTLHWISSALCRLGVWEKQKQKCPQFQSTSWQGCTFTTHFFCLCFAFRSYRRCRI